MTRTLPDCDALPPPDVELSASERSDLVKRLAEEGPRAIDDFVKEQSRTESSIARAVERFRALLEQQAKQVKEQADREYSNRLLEARRKADDAERQLSKEELEALERKRQLEDKLGEVLQNALLNDPLVKLVAEAPAGPELQFGLWTRIRRRIRAFFAAVAEALSRFWAWLTGKKPERRRLPEGTSLLISIPGLEGTLSGLDARFDNALMTSPELKKGFEAKVMPEAGFFSKLRFRLSSALGMKPTGAAREAFHKRLMKLLSRRKKEADNETSELEKRIAELKRQRGALGSSLSARERDLSSEKEKLLTEMGKRQSTEPEKLVRDRVERDLARSGLISKDAKGNLQITARLVDRFADIVLSGEIRNLPSRYKAALGRTVVHRGTYERDRMKTIDEISRMDIVESLVAARLAHPSKKKLQEDDIRVNREQSGTSLHVVLAFDKSSSMDENKRIQAAKKAVLALFKAVKRRDPRNTVDLVGFDTSVRPMDLVQVWESKPGGFTNTGAAIKVASELLDRGHSDQKLIYLITDGFPEAYTENGKDIAGDNERSLAYALTQAKGLRRFPDLRLVHILLEPKERIFVDAAQKLVDAARGKLITTDPGKLASDMLVDYSAA
jgi:Mg-chelatase subunit ChlD